MNRQSDELTRNMAQSVTRRASFKKFGLGLAGMAVAAFSLAAAADGAGDPAPAKTPAAIPWSQLSAKAGAEYQGDGLTVAPTTEGARLRCVFQRLEGEATREGLWLTSAVCDEMKDRFRVVAADVRRLTSTRTLKPKTQNGIQSLPASAANQAALPRTGTVEVADKLVRFIRSGLTEEYTVSMDGVRQDFIIERRPGGAGELAVRLAVSGARVEPAVASAQLVLVNSGRKIAYNRLHVTDATGKELSARMEIASGSAAAPAALVNASLT